MRLLYTLGLALVVALLTNVSFAQDESEKSECSKCPLSQGSEVAVSTDSDETAQKSGCSKCATMTAAMEKLPKMMYQVGEETVCCSVAAEELAKKLDKPIQYVVSEKKFEKQDEAYVALVESTEQFVNNFLTPAKCEKSGTTTVAGSSCSCPVEAGKKAELVKKAVEPIHLTYVVGKNKCECPNEAAKLAKDSGEKTVYVVSGKETCCDLEARLNLARAKYEAAVKAIAAVEKPAETETDAKSGT
jgi:hypothetical protein